jgi:hypothetical protein
MSGHLQTEQIAALLTPDGSPLARAARAATIRHLLTGCPRCAALARQVLSERGYRLAAGRLELPLAEPLPQVSEVSYDDVFERLQQRLPELVAHAMLSKSEP